MVDLLPSNEPFFMNIKSYKGNYHIHFTDCFLSSLKSEAKTEDIFLIDENVWHLYRKQFSYFEKSNSIICLPSGEKTKSFDAAGKLIFDLMELGFKRNHRLIAVGGGIVQDAVAFVASILFRGVEWIFVPTTLLAQGDSCIGSKTSVNFDNYKNLLGGFYPPSNIYIDAAFLDTLSDHEIRSGLGEMLHFFMIGGRSDFEIFRDNFEHCFDDKNAIKKLTERSLEIKKEMIERDEFDEGPRKVFNYGHTFGHALEGITNYQIPHGIAVSYGMDMANKVSVYLGLLEENIALESRKLLSQVWGNTVFPKIDTKEYLNLLSKDKKNVGSKLNLILTSGWGNMFMQEVIPDEGFSELVNQILNFYYSNNN